MLSVRHRLGPPEVEVCFSNIREQVASEFFGPPMREPALAAAVEPMHDTTTYEGKGPCER
jgi:hypothetical protein